MKFSVTRLKPQRNVVSQTVERIARDYDAHGERCTVLEREIAERVDELAQRRKVMEALNNARGDLAVELLDAELVV